MLLVAASDVNFPIMVTAISLALAMAGAVIAYLWWAVRAVAGGTSWLWFIAGAPCAYFALPVAFSVLWFALSWFFRAKRPQEVRLGFAGMVGLWCHEVLAIAGSAPRMICYRWLIRDPPTAPGAMPVLLLHGVLCNAGVLHPMKKYLTARGVGPIYALSYGPPLASIELFADQTSKKIDAILAATAAQQVVIVAHSMGGLVARAHLRKFGGAKVRRLITLGAPHQGSMLAYIFPGVSLSQLRPGNAWLSELGASAATAGPPIVSIWSWHDSMVAPQTSSVLEGAENIALKGIGHNALLRDAEVFERVAAEIERAVHDRPQLHGKTHTAIHHFVA